MVVFIDIEFFDNYQKNYLSEDISRFLIKVLERFVDDGNTVLVIELNLMSLRQQIISSI